VRKVEALIHPSSLAAVVKALDRLDVGGLTISELRAPDHAGSPVRHRGVRYAVDGVPTRLRVEVVSTAAYAGPIAWAIATAARRSHVDDGLVTIATVENACRIRTGERGPAAVSARLDHADAAPSAVVARTPEHATLMSDWTKVLLTNVVLSTVLVVLLLHAPVGYAALGAGGAGLALWVRERRAQARRTR